jgi:hypothetical protein
MRFKSVLKRLFDKIVHDALPTALASILGGLLLTHFQIGQAPQSTTVRVTPASPEMMQLLRDEHVAIVDYVKDQAASEKNRGVAQPDPQPGLAEAAAPGPAQIARALPVARPTTVIPVATPKSIVVRGKNSVAGASQLGQPVAPAQSIDVPAQPTARADDSLMAKTIGIKDRVISATQHAVSATVGFIPSWFGSVGDRIGGEGPSPRPPADLVSASWTMPGAADR